MHGQLKGDINNDEKKRQEDEDKRGMFRRICHKSGGKLHGGEGCPISHPTSK